MPVRALTPVNKVSLEWTKASWWAGPNSTHSCNSREGECGRSKVVTSGLGRLPLRAFGSAALSRAAGAGGSSLGSHFLFLAGSGGGGGGAASGGVKQLLVLLAAQRPPWERPWAQRPLLVGLAEGVGAELAEGLRVLAAHIAVVPRAVPAACRRGDSGRRTVRVRNLKNVQPMQFHPLVAWRQKKTTVLSLFLKSFFFTLHFSLSAQQCKKGQLQFAGDSIYQCERLWLLLVNIRFLLRNTA